MRWSNRPTTRFPDMYATAPSDHSALVEFCTSARNIQQATSQHKQEKKTLRQSQKEIRNGIVELLKNSGPRACIALRAPDGHIMYAYVGETKGAQRRLTCKSIVEAVRALRPSDLEGASADDVLAAVLKQLTGDAKTTLKMAKSAPRDMLVIQAPDANDAHARLSQHTARLKELTTNERVQCAPFKERCATHRQAVVDHLRGYNPEGMRQQVQLAQHGETRSYTLKATHREGRLTRKELLALTRDSIAAVCSHASPSLATPHPMLQHLQDPQTLGLLEQELRRRISAAAPEGKTDVTLVPNDNA